MNASTATRVLGYDTSKHQIIPCVNTATDDCVSVPGFDCIISCIPNINPARLERGCI